MTTALPTWDEIFARQQEIQTEMQRLGAHDQLTRAQETRFNGLRDEYEDLELARKRLERRKDLDLVLAAARGEDGGGTVSIGRAREVEDRAGAQSTSERARRNIEVAHKLGTMQTEAAERAEALVTAGPLGERSVAARWAAIAGDPAYLRAFSHLVADPERGHLMWSEEEREAFAAVQRYRSEERAMSLTDANGGYMVPMTLDPSINLTNGGATNPLPQIARVVTTTTDSWTGVTSAGATAEWLAEATEAADGSPTIDDEPIPVHKGSCFVPFSYEVGMDAVNFAQEITAVMRDAIDVQEAVAFTTGSGSGQPTGFVTALTGTSSEVNAAADDTFASADVYTLQNALPARFQGRAAWLASLPIMNLLQQFETSGGALKFPGLVDGRLLNRPIYENSSMDSTVTTSGAVSNFVLAYGDWQQFVIVRRIGTTVELIPHLFGANRRPTGQRGFHAWYRTGSDVLVNNAFRLLDVASAA